MCQLLLYILLASSIGTVFICLKFVMCWIGGRYFSGYLLTYTVRQTTYPTFLVVTLKKWDQMNNFLCEYFWQNLPFNDHAQGSRFTEHLLQCNCCNTEVKVPEPIPMPQYQRGSNPSLHHWLLLYCQSWSVGRGTAWSGSRCSSTAGDSHPGRWFTHRWSAGHGHWATDGSAISPVHGTARRCRAERRCHGFARRRSWQPGQLFTCYYLLVCITFLWFVFTFYLWYISVIDFIWCEKCIAGYFWHLTMVLYVYSSNIIFITLTFNTFVPQHWVLA